MRIHRTNEQRNAARKAIIDQRKGFFSLLRLYTRFQLIITFLSLVLSLILLFNSTYAYYQFQIENQKQYQPNHNANHLDRDRTDEIVRYHRNIMNLYGINETDFEMFFNRNPQSRGNDGRKARADGTLRKKTSQDQRPSELTYQSKVPLRCKRRNETVQEFLEIFESWMLINRWSDEEASLYLNCLIEERSLKQKLSQCERFNSYMAMKAALLSVDKAAKDRKIIQLRNVKFFIGGNVDAYFDKVSKLVDEIYAEEVSSMQIKRDMILSGLDPEMIAKLIVNQALPDDITNLKNLIFGLNLTMINKNRNKEWQNAKKNAKKFCQNCKTKTHNTEDCRSKKQNHPKCEKITNDISNPRYFVPMKFNGEEVLALFDSGSNRTIAPGNILKPETRLKNDAVRLLNMRIYQ
ncbi:hypothetical protein SSS_02817 [Sarcoptes scabiei]|uniref:Uncharacterized protein n=1 Tax=Sarcoptes scabiei TaxID=52283 RepID=A0A834R8X8_SARSC|nr:hypothetical protein SSS_02817 [Sarcoptes scabiei]